MVLLERLGLGWPDHRELIGAAATGLLPPETTVSIYTTVSPIFINLKRILFHFGYHPNAAATLTKFPFYEIFASLKSPTFGLNQGNLSIWGAGGGRCNARAAAAASRFRSPLFCTPLGL